MMYYVKIHATKGCNNLQKRLIEETERWDRTLIASSEAREACIDLVRGQVLLLNKAFPKCKPCCLRRNESGFSIHVDGCCDSFMLFVFNKVKHTYDGFALVQELEEQEGGEK